MFSNNPIYIKIDPGERFVCQIKNSTGTHTFIDLQPSIYEDDEQSIVSKMGYMIRIEFSMHQTIPDGVENESIQT